MICKCDCGNTTTKRLPNLLNGHTKSCGCLQKKIAREIRIKDISGQKFGKLTPIRLVDRMGKGRKTLWECKCECGNTAVVSYSNLTTGVTMSCGCLVSKNEEKIRKILFEKGLIFKTQYKFNDLRSPDKNYPLKFDFAIFDNDGYLVMLLEYDGKQHFKKTGYSSNPKNNEEKLLIVQRNDDLKNKYCKNNGFSLLRIPYTFEDEVENLILCALREKGLIEKE